MSVSVSVSGSGTSPPPPLPPPPEISSPKAVPNEKNGMTFEEPHSRAAAVGLLSMAEQAAEPGHRKTLLVLARLLARVTDLNESPRPIAIVQSGPEMTREEILAAQQEEWDHIAGIRLAGTIEGLLDYDADYIRLLRRRFDELNLTEIHGYAVKVAGQFGFTMQAAEMSKAPAEKPAPEGLIPSGTFMNAETVFALRGTSREIGLRIGADGVFHFRVEPRTPR